MFYTRSDQIFAFLDQGSSIFNTNHYFDYNNRLSYLNYGCIIKYIDINFCKNSILNVFWINLLNIKLEIKSNKSKL